MNLNFKTYGSGKPLIILHGLFGSLDNWHTVATELGAFFYVITIDQRNHGKSFHSDEFNYEVMADDIKRFIDENNLKDIKMIGHSMGGKTAMKLALSYPEYIKKLVVVDISPKKYPGGHDEILNALCEFPIDKIQNRNEADKILSEKISNIGIRQFLLKNLDRKKDNGFQWKMNLSVIKDNYDEVNKTVSSAKTFNNPVLFIKGGKSNYIQDDEISDIKKIFPLATLTIIENSGHWVHAESKDEFVEIVKEFLL